MPYSYAAPVDDPSDSAPTAGPTLRVVSGRVSFRERIALPPGAVVTVRVADVSRADGPAVILAQNAIAVLGQLPVPFELAVDAADIDERADIAVWARLRSVVGTWVSDTHTPVLTRGAGNTADVVVRRTTET
jgi:putative lipoprotein